MATSTIGTTRTALQTLIAAQLSGVNVFSFPPGDKALEGTASYEFVALSDVTGTQNHLVFGGGREESFVFSGVIWVAKSGTGDTVSASAENRALALLAGVETAVRNDDTPGSAFHAQVVNYRVSNGAEDVRSWCGIEFDIDVESHI